MRAGASMTEESVLVPHLTHLSNPRRSYGHRHSNLDPNESPVQSAAEPNPQCIARRRANEKASDLDFDISSL